MPRELAAASEQLSSQRNHVRTLLGQIGRIGSMFGNMQWSLVQFDHDCLITSDQPVVMLPLTAATVSPASSVPPHGFLNIMEVHFALDSRQLLLMTWVDAPDTVRPLNGTYRQACSVNCAVRAQALQQWMSRPQTTPPFHSPPVLEPRVYAVSTELLSGYTVQVATESRRRAAADRLMSTMIKENAPRNEMRWIDLAPAQAAA